MKIEHLKIEKLGQVSSIEINGEKAEKVLDYNISISAYGDSELNITFDISDALTEIETEDTEKEEKKITKFDAIKGIQDSRKFSEMIFDLVSHTGAPESLAELLKEEVADEGLQNLKSIAQSGYPLSLDLKQ